VASTLNSNGNKHTLKQVCSYGLSPRGGRNRTVCTNKLDLFGFASQFHGIHESFAEEMLISKDATESFGKDAAELANRLNACPALVMVTEGEACKF
jgi:hypothetical protein